MYETLKNLDRRWIFLMMFLAVAIPILAQSRFPEVPTGLAQSTFDEIDQLPAGSKILMAFDYDPASEGELGPMAKISTLHCCLKGHRMYFMTLWPAGPQMVRQAMDQVIRDDFGDEYVYGENYVNLGFKAGNEGVIKVITTDIKQEYTTDARGTDIEEIPMMDGVRSIQQMDLMLNVSAGYPGTKEWVQYAVTAYPEEITLVGGCTGVQAPLLYPYIPQQLPGLLAAIKGASEYESLVLEKYPPPKGREGVYMEAQRRMGPQLVAHVLMVVLILGGNIIFFIERKREARS